jgi:hypothetical protein
MLGSSVTGAGESGCPAAPAKQRSASGSCILAGMTLKAGARLALCAAGFAVTLAFAPSPSQAQAAPAPIGHWSTTPPGEDLYVYQNGMCSFLANGRVQVQGRCSWNPSSRGGILTITYPMPLEPGKVRYNIVWINRQTISVWGDVMHLRR